MKIEKKFWKIPSFFLNLVEKWKSVSIEQYCTDLQCSGKGRGRTKTRNKKVNKKAIFNVSSLSLTVSLILSAWTPRGIAFFIMMRTFKPIRFSLFRQKTNSHLTRKRHHTYYTHRRYLATKFKRFRLRGDIDPTNQTVSKKMFLRFCCSWWPNQMIPFSASQFFFLLRTKLSFSSSFGLFLLIHIKIWIRVLFYFFCLKSLKHSITKTIWLLCFFLYCRSINNLFLL